MRKYLLNILSGIIVTSACYSQSLISVVPDIGNQGQSYIVTLSGQSTSFGQGTSTTITWFNQGSSTIYPDFINVISNTIIDANFNFTYNDSPGYYDVNVYNSLDGNMILYDGFFLNLGNNPPQIILVNPDSAYQGQNFTVFISGQNTNFTQGTGTVIWFNQGTSTIFMDSVNVSSATELAADFSIPNDAALGLWDVNVQDPVDGTVTLNDGFRIDPLETTPPQIVLVSPDTAYRGQILTVFISGQNTNFTQGAGTTVWFNQGTSIIFMDSVNVSSATDLAADFSIPNDAALGLWDVNVQDPTDGIVTYNNGIRIDSLSTVIKVRSKDEEISFSFYPNPFKNKLVIRYNLKESTAISLEVCDVSGKVLMTIINKRQTSGNYMLEKDLRDFGLKPGIYFIRLKADNNELVMKMIKL